jgi:hypothetical protein
VIRAGSDVVLDDLEGAYHRVGTECPPYDAPPSYPAFSSPYTHAKF